MPRSMAAAASVPVASSPSAIRTGSCTSPIRIHEARGTYE